MTGEMSYINTETGIDSNGEHWPIQHAIAKAIGGELKPFDSYQGPYITVGRHLTVSNSPYAIPVQHLGIIRLWVIPDEIGGQVYREDNDQICPYYDEISAIMAACDLLEIDYEGRI